MSYPNPKQPKRLFFNVFHVYTIQFYSWKYDLFSHYCVNLWPWFQTLFANQHDIHLHSQANFAAAFIHNNHRRLITHWPPDWPRAETDPLFFVPETATQLANARREIKHFPSNYHLSAADRQQQQKSGWHKLSAPNRATFSAKVPPSTLSPAGQLCLDGHYRLPARNESHGWVWTQKCSLIALIKSIKHNFAFDLLLFCFEFTIQMTWKNVWAD